jgi:CelD/BcsL family acetyltransferase involved in cellulose biosynthesis
VISQWADIVGADENYTSPYFHPSFTLAVGNSRPGKISVAVAMSGETVLACLPFEPDHLGIGRPVGGPLSDYHGIVSRPGVALDPSGVLRACGLTGWRFDHLPATDPTFAAAATRNGTSPRIDVGTDWAGFVQQTTSKSMISTTERKARALAREVGPLRLCTLSDDEAAWAVMRRWKSEQYIRTGLPDLMSQRWVSATLSTIWRTRQPGFAGALTVLYAGDSIAAVHFGMRSSLTWHWWFPTYAPGLSKYSPGAILLLEMIKAAPGMGIRWIDLGKGAQTYKDRIANDVVPLLEGVALRPSLRGYSWRAGHDALIFARESARAGKRAVKRLLPGSAPASAPTVSTD